ncbi:flagellar motor protein MotB [Anaerobacillus sp. MEB173]|uniref:flagellar motor protein MotB n=1 Tax=Anaerobacillus sp. MEB173 TaxID=3383345 RepID=UPI003F8F66F5
MRRKKKHDEHIDESWLIPYADILTLLLALFIVLFAASTIDSIKYQQIVESFGSSFGGQGLLENNSIVPEIENSIVTGEREKNEKQDRNESEAAQEVKDLEEIQEKINNYINDNHLDLHLETSLTKEGLRITILDLALFDSGSATVKTESKQLAVEISKLLVTDPPRKVSVAGHTDNVPIFNEQFRSNWDLSAMRAVNFMKFMLDNKDLNAEDFSATGYGEYQPVASNDSSDGREKNRRVEVLILPNYSLENEQEVPEM